MSVPEGDGVKGELLRKNLNVTKESESEETPVYNFKARDLALLNNRYSSKAANRPIGSGTNHQNS